VGWNVVCQPGYMAEDAVAAATSGLGDGRETSGSGDLHILDELVRLIQYVTDWQKIWFGLAVNQCQ